jgi:Tol biopolymer transport system component
MFKISIKTTILISSLLAGCRSSATLPAPPPTLTAATVVNPTGSPVSVLPEETTTIIPPTSTPTSTPRSSPLPAPAPEGFIVFYSERDGDAEIYVMNPDGNNQRPLTDNEADDYSPSWSPDGRLIIFESDRDDPNPRTCFPNCNYNLYVMNADGSQVRKVTDLPGAEWNADWSPDGRSLVFIAGDIGYESYGIYKISMDGGEPQPLLVDDFENQAPDWSPNGKQIAFSSNRDGNFDIFVMNADGSDIHKILDTGLDDYFPDWSPDGSRLVLFAADWPAVKQDIYTMNADGSSLQNITNTSHIVDEDPKWSPDGSKIIFQSDRDGNFEIYMMNPDGSQPQNLTRNPGRDYWPDWWMPPETKIAFVSDHSGKPQIYLMPAQGAQTQSAIDLSDLQPLTNDRYDNYFPSWSPDGTQIAYYTHFSWQSWAIMIINADGSNPRQLTVSEGETICSFGPVWSPDGQRIAFTIEPNPYPTCEMKNTEIAAIRIDGSGFKILTKNEANDLAGPWTPDGSQLVFSSDRDGNSQIYIMNADGSNPQRLTEPDSTNSMPAISPDGRFIAFVSDRDGNDEIYAMDVNGSNPRRLTNNPANDWQPSWSPDGKQIVFISGLLRSGFDIFMMYADGSGLRQLTNFPGWEFEPAWQPAHNKDK